MGVIKPTITLTSNASTATTDAGPLSIALSLSATDSLDVDQVESQIIVIPSGSTSTMIVDGSANEGTGNGYTPGIDGCYMYIKNIQTSGTALVYVGLLADGATTDISGDFTSSTRSFTLKAGEFAWFPYDYTGDIVVQASAADQSIEFWRFDRSTS